MRGKRAENRPLVIDDEEPRPQAALLLAKARLTRKHDKKEAVLVFHLPLPEGDDTPGVPDEAVVALRYMTEQRDCEELKISGESGPWNMTCRALPLSAGVPRPSETFLRAVTWRKLRLVREEGGIELRFEATVPLDAASGAWLLEVFGTQVFAVLEEAQGELPAAQVNVAPGAVQ